MNVAVCFFGLVGGAAGKDGYGGSLGPSIAGKLNMKNLIEQNRADVFIHSWSTDAEEDLIDLYQPTDYLVESQLEFDHDLKPNANRDFAEMARRAWDFIFNRHQYEATGRKWRAESFRAHSRWYSQAQSLRLKADFEKKHGFIYDAVIVVRLDVAFYTPLDMSTYDLRYFYASNWNDAPDESSGEMNYQNHHLHRGFLDFWFFSNSSNMDRFGTLYSRINHYHPSPHRSSYQHASYLGLTKRYTLFRWEDHEMVRRKELDAEQ